MSFQSNFESRSGLSITVYTKCDSATVIIVRKSFGQLDVRLGVKAYFELKIVDDFIEAFSWIGDVTKYDYCEVLMSIDETIEDLRRVDEYIGVMILSSIRSEFIRAVRDKRIDNLLN